MTPSRDNQVYVEVRTKGRVFRMTLGIPDSPIMETDLRPEYIRPKVSNAMKAIFGRISEV
jgi:hypothetical protein